MLIAFSISVIGALAVTFIEQELDRSLVYGIGLITYVIGYFVLTFLKKESWFPYYMVLVGNTTMIFYILLHGGGLQTLALFFFFLFIATAYFITPVFVVGFSLGIVGIVATRFFSETAQEEVIEQNFLSFVAAYLLSGMFSIIVLRLYRSADHT